MMIIWLRLLAFDYTQGKLAFLIAMTEKNRPLDCARGDNVMDCHGASFLWHRLRSGQKEEMEEVRVIKNDVFV
jgi:hypothetical protein